MDMKTAAAAVKAAVKAAVPARSSGAHVALEISIAGSRREMVTVPAGLVHVAACIANAAGATAANMGLRYPAYAHDGRLVFVSVPA